MTLLRFVLSKTITLMFLTKLPSGWWDGLCNGMRGWFPSNYVKTVEDNESPLEREARIRNVAYRLSLMSNTNTAHWTQQRTEDGVDTYYYNDVTGEMRIDPPSEFERFRESSLTLENNESLWSDQSTIASSLMEREAQQLTKTLTKNSQTSCFGSNHDLPSLISNPDIVHPTLTAPSPMITEPLDWPKLYRRIALCIQQLSVAAKNEQRHSYRPYVMHIVNAIRLMLVASNTLDKESSTVLAHPNLRTHHRTMMASMSKLALSAQSVHEDTRIVSECNELLGNLKPFIAGCQDLGVPLISVEPQLGQSKQEEEQTVPNHRYSLQLNLAESFETMGTAIQDSAETIMGYVSSWSGDDKTSLVVLLFTHFRNLSNQTGLFLAYLEETDFSRVLEQSEMDDLHRGQRALSDALGLLFVKLQAMTNEHLADFDMALKETREATAALFGPIELICVSVLHLANKNQSRRNSILSPEAPVPLERHNSEQILPSPKPPTVQRSQTQISTKKISEFFPEEEVSTSKINMFFYDENEVHTKPDKPKAPKEEPKEEPVVNERPDFLKHDYDPNEIAYTAEGSVKGGTLSALVERLTLHDYFDMNFINTFLLTYRSFCSTLDLLNLLESRYNLICPEGLTEEESTVWEEKKLKLVRLRVFNVLKNWLELYYNEDDSVLLDRLMHFIETHIRNTLKFSNGQLEQLINKRKEGVPMEQVGLKKMVLSLPAPPEPIYPKNRKQVRLLEIDTLEIARQLTIMDFKLYSAIRPIECLNKAWSKEEDTVAVNIRASIEYCNQITSWVSDVILSQQDIKKRSIVIKYWVQVAEKCRMLNNFNTCMAILSAFDNSSVGRLKRTWEVVGTRTNQTLQHIRKLMGANRNFVEYRALIHSINPPCIPFLGIYLQDLTFIEDGNPNELKKNKEMINFAKRAKTAEVIREIQQYQSSLYQLKTVEEIQEFIKSNLLSTRDEDQLYSESLKIEPREREDEKITRLLQESGFL